MKSLLYLVHRIPYPPNKGDKITSFNMLRYLSQHFNIYLACFVDDKNDWQYTDEVKKYCADSCFIGLNPKVSKIKSLTGLISQKSLSEVYYQNPQMQQWIDNTLLNQTIDSVLIFSGVMAQYVSKKLNEQVKTVLDLEDVDSQKWAQYAENHSWPMNWLYKREANYLLNYEATMSKEFDKTVLVSKEEGDFFTGLIPEVKDKVIHRTQGVDSQFFDPSKTYQNLYQKTDKILVFVGAMDYWPNIDAAIWFGKEVFPKIHQNDSSIQFYIVGMNPADEVMQLNELDGITVTGSVDDVRPYLAHAKAAILPLRVARGIQNKVLEAMAMELPVIATDNALQGIIDCETFEPIEANTEEEITNAVSKIMAEHKSSRKTGRDCILKNYNWDTNLKKIQDLLT